MPKKTPRPRPLSGAGGGKGPGACVFRGPVRPVTNSTWFPGLEFRNPHTTYFTMSDFIIGMTKEYEEGVSLEATKVIYGDVAHNQDRAHSYQALVNQIYI